MTIITILKNLLKKIDTNSIYLGVKKGYNMPTLPQNILDFQNKPIIRIIRVLAGICLLLLLTSKYLLFPLYLHNIIMILGIVQSLQISIIFIIKFIYGIYTLKYKSKDFEVRNSPHTNFKN